MDDGRFRFEEAFSVDFASGDLRIAGRLRDMPRLGWSFADPGVAERRWTVGPDGRVVIPLPALPGRYVLELSLKVPDRNFQDWHRITVSANDRTLFEGVVPEATTLACPLPADLLQGPGPLSILVQQPEAATAPAHSPARRRMAYTRLRLLRFAGTEGAAEPGAVEDEIADPDTAPAAQLVTQFESLGDNCEFGIVQRRAGAEPLGLLRFSAMHLDRLLSGLADGYAGVESPAGIEPRLHGEPGGAPREYVVHQSPHGLVYHTYVLETQASAEQVRAQESVKLGFLQRKLMEDLEEGRKIAALGGAGRCGASARHGGVADGRTDARLYRPAGAVPRRHRCFACMLAANLPERISPAVDDATRAAGGRLTAGGPDRVACRERAAWLTHHV